MKKTRFKQRIENARRAFFENDGSSPSEIAVRQNSGGLRENSSDDDFRRAPVRFWAFARCLLFYLPGVLLLFSVSMFLSDYVVTGDYSPGNVTFSFFWYGAGAFLMMLGIGKLKDLKYLPVVAAVTAASFAVGLTTFSVPVEVSSLLFPFVILLLPGIAYVGYLVKRRIDREIAERFD